jgi:hypothetical protein
MTFKIDEKDIFPRPISHRPGFDLRQVNPSFRKVLKNLIECSGSMRDGEKNGSLILSGSFRVLSGKN